MKTADVSTSAHVLGADRAKDQRVYRRLVWTGGNEFGLHATCRDCTRALAYRNPEKFAPLWAGKKKGRKRKDASALLSEIAAGIPYSERKRKK